MTAAPRAASAGTYQPPNGDSRTGKSARSNSSRGSKVLYGVAVAHKGWQRRRYFARQHCSKRRVCNDHDAGSAEVKDPELPIAECWALQVAGIATLVIVEVGVGHTEHRFHQFNGSIGMLPTSRRYRGIRRSILSQR
jgi:hypothetical protein